MLSALQVVTHNPTHILLSHSILSAANPTQLENLLI